MSDRTKAQLLAENTRLRAEVGRSRPPRRES
jgi:hypothetical protein